MAVLYDIIVVNTASGCDTLVSSQVNVTQCVQNVIVRISSGSNAIGPFDIYTGSTGSTPVYTSVSRDDMVYGKVLTLSDPSACISPTPTPSVTSTPTPTPSATITATPTPTPTMTPTPSPASTFAYLFIEPQTGATDIGQYLYDLGVDFFGFTNFSSPNTANPVQFETDMNAYVDYSGWTAGTFPAVRTQVVPQTTGGIDSFGNAIVEFNFTTHEVPSGTVSGSAWYMWIIPTGSTNGYIQTLIDYNNDGNPNTLTAVNTDSTLRTNTFTYSGGTIPAGTYRIYTTFTDVSFYLNNDDDIYFKGNTVS